MKKKFSELTKVRFRQSYLQAIRVVLRNFTRLRILRINCIDYWQMGDVKCQLDKDFATVTEWGESCPSLVEVTLPREPSFVLLLPNWNTFFFYQLIDVLFDKILTALRGIKFPIPYGFQTPDITPPLPGSAMPWY